MVRAGLLVLLAILVLPAAWFGLRAAWSDMVTLKARDDITRWQKQGVLPDIAAWGTVRNSLAHGIELTPDDPKLYEHMGYLYGVRAIQARRVPELRKAYLEQAIQFYVAALRLRPMSPHTWANIALAHHMLGQHDAMLWRAFDLAMRYGANEPDVQIKLMEIGLQRWPTLEEPRRAALRSAFARANPKLGKQLEQIRKRLQVEMGV